MAGARSIVLSLLYDFPSVGGFFAAYCIMQYIQRPIKHPLIDNICFMRQISYVILFDFGEQTHYTSPETGLMRNKAAIK